MNDFFGHAAAFFARLLCGIALAVVLYILTAPPLMIAMIRKNPRERPRIYEPLVSECEAQPKPEGDGQTRAFGSVLNVAVTRANAGAVLGPSLPHAATLCRLWC